MDWIEIIVKILPGDIDVAESIAHMVVPYGIYIEDYSNLESEVLEIANIDLIDEELLKKNRSECFIHVYISPESNPKEAISFLEEKYNTQGIKYEINTNSCKQEDWINNWKKYFKPIEVGNKLLIRPIWEEKCDCGERIVLDLEPGLAFGTGTHETTRLCMELLEKYINPSMDVLDVGCGSGILSIAALLLGANSAVGVDIDELSVKTATQNAIINKVNDKFTAVCGNLTDKVVGKFNIIVANIVADVIMELTDQVKKYMYKDSVYIMSGIIEARIDEVKEVLKSDFNIVSEQRKNGWVALAATLK